MLLIMTANLKSKLLHADQLYDRIGLALTSSANFFINYVVFQVLCLCPPHPMHAVRHNATCYKMRCGPDEVASLIRLSL